MIVDNNEEITTGNDGTEMCSSGADVAVEMCSPESHDTCGDNSVATKRNLVEILRFRHFSRHVVFDAEGDKYRNKRIEDYITVSVVIDMECGNTKN